MTKSLRLWSALGAFAALLVSAPAMAQEGPQSGGPVEECVSHLRVVTVQTTDAIGDIASHGVATIKRLDEDGATDEEITQAAVRARRALAGAGARGSKGVNISADRCIAALRQFGAPPMAAHAVQTARRNALGVIGQATHRGQRVVTQALQEAIGVDDGAEATSVSAAAED